MLTADDVRACRDECVEYLQAVADRDWTSAIPEIDMHVAGVVAHVAGANMWYSIDLSAQGGDVEAIVPEVDSDAGPSSLILAFRTAASVLASVVATSADDVRGFHPFGQADPSGFATISCDEMIVHTHDVSRAFDREFSPSPELAAKVLRRLFPWAVDVDDDPWVALQWANGRIAVDEHERLSKWRWHCAPLAEWDGEQPRPGQ